MALTATMFHFSVQLADMDRSVYEALTLRVAQQPSETRLFMLTRVLAYCLEYEEGIVFTEGVAATDEPAIVVRDLTGRVTHWIEVGAPDAERVHRGSKLAGRAAVYTHRDPLALVRQYAEARIHQAEAVPVYAFDREMLPLAAEALERRSSLALSVTEGHLYLDIDGKHFTSEIRRFNAAGA
ncbi:YaeQ family protein [Algiphilus sp.]|uniref:YaeQ family protein n=1 Tax=Algiphilus sp. TaxID=1872431 RepID=UPI003B521E91